MSYKLEKPCTSQELTDFLVAYQDNKGMRVEETDVAYYALEENEIMEDGVPVVDKDWNEKQTLKRKENFESNFIETAYTKDNVIGWYRQVPNGYSNAPQSIDIINNIVHNQGGLSAEVAAMMKFYKQPNYRYKNQCTEEWLIAHSFSPDVMTVEQWDAFYFDFQTRWAMLKYKQAEGLQ